MGSSVNYQLLSPLSQGTFQRAIMQSATVEAIVQNTYLHGTHVDGLWQAVDDSSFTSNPFLPGTPKDLLESGHFNTEVEVILGTTKDEGIIWLIDPLKNNSLFEKMQREWDTMWGPLLVGLHDLDDVTDVDLYKSYTLLAFYIGGLENLGTLTSLVQPQAWTPAVRSR